MVSGAVVPFVARMHCYSRIGNNASGLTRIAGNTHMKTSPRTVAIAVAWIFTLAAPGLAEDTVGEGPDAVFDAELAAELGADNYGMRRYVIAFLKTGPNQEHDAQTARELQQAHMANINRLAAEGSLILAGPFLDAGELRGIFLFDVSSVEEARELTQSDPAVQAGRLAVELHPWYGSAALLKINDIHARISREMP